MAAPLGNLERARTLNRGLIQDSRTSAATVGDLRSASQILAYNPVLSARLTFAGPEQQRQEVRRMELLIRRLHAIDPAQAALGGGVGGGVRGWDGFGGISGDERRGVDANVAGS